MRRATENQGDARTLADYFPQRSKVKDLALQQCSLPHFASFLQETPMKPSQVPNQLPHPPLRKMLSPQSPELCHRDRLGPPRHPHHPLGPIYSSGYPPNSPTTMSTSPNRHHPMQRDRPGPPAHSAQPPAFIPSSPQNRPHPMARHRLSPLQHSAQPPGSFSPRLVPVSPTHSGTTFNRSYPLTPRGFPPATPQFMKDLSNHAPPSHIRRDEGMESKVNSSHSGSKNVTAQTQESNKAQSSDLRNPVQTVQLHRPPMTPPFNARAAQDVCPPSISHSAHWSPGNSQRTLWGYGSPLSTQSPDRSSSSSLQDQHHKRTPSSEKLIPALDLNDSSQKRHRELEDCDAGAKKLCLQGANSGKAQTPKPTVGTSLSTSLSQPSSSHSTALEPSTKTTDSHLSTKPCGQTNFVGLSSTFKPAQSSCASLSPKPCIKRRPSMGAQQAYINSTQNQTVLIELTSTSKPGEVSLRKRGEGNDNMEKSSSSLSSEVPPQDPGSSPHFQLSRQHSSGRANRSPSDTQVKTPSRGNRSEKSRKSDSTTPKSASKLSLSGRKAGKHKTGRPRRPVIAPYDINELFTPDPMTYVVTPAHKAAKPKTDGETVKSHTSENNCSSSSNAPVTGSSCRKTQNVTVTGLSHAGDAKAPSASPACNLQVSFPTVALQRVKLEDLRAICSKSSELKTGPLASSGRQLRDESVKSDEKHTSLLPNNVRSCALENDSTASEQTSASHCSKSPEKQASEGSRKQASEEDPIDVELDLGLGLSFTLDLDLTHSSQSSEDEQLLSLQEMMERVTKPPDTPDKGAFSEPSTPGHHSCQSKTLPLPSTTKPGIYKNNLDQMLKEINTNKKAKEIETQLLTACKEDLLRIAEYEEAEENREEGISTEHQEFLQRYSLMSNAIREVPPGEVVFNLEKFGRIFNQDTLQLRQCMVNPQEMAQKTLLWSSPAQLRLHLNIGLFQEAYDSHSPCPTQVTRFLFKMMSIHSERLVSDKLLQALCDIACTAAYQIVKHGNQQFKVWVPSLADVALVLMNMGVAFVTLFPFENLQPQFTEGDLLEDIYIKSERHSSNKDQSTFPEHNCNNILKYLSYCMGLCPRAYSDEELLLLLTVVGRLGLDTRLILQSSVELYPLQGKIVNNIRDWDNMLPRICLALTDLSDDHHNMCLLVQILPDNTRGKQLRRHLSLSMISKLLDGHCTYRPKGKEIQLSELRLFLPRMQPSTLVRGMMSSSIRSQKDKEDDMATLDQQSYYLCYSLLTLANEASNFQFFPAHQKEQLLILCSELETHVKCDIRESEKCLYRSKVKDLVARIYTKWQMLLQRTRPLHGKLYDYWTPLSVDKFTRSQEEQEVDRSNDEEGLAMEEDVEEETSGTEENELLMIPDDDDEEEKADGEDGMDDKRGGDTKPKETEDKLTMDETFKMVDNTEEMDRDGTFDETLKTGDETKPEDVEEDDTMGDIFKMVEDMKPDEVEGEYTTDETFKTVENTKPEEMEGDGTSDNTFITEDDARPEEVEGDGTLDDTNEKEGVTELGQEMEPQGTKESHVIDELIEAGNMQRAEVETENLVETREAAACDLVS